MATALTEVRCGSKKYYISHTGTTVYYSTEGPGKGSNTARGLEFKSNQLILKKTGKPAKDFDICQEISK